MTLKFGTKGETLLSLRGKLSNAVVDDVYLFDVRSWLDKGNEIIDTVVSKFPDSKLAVRSSAKSEDLFTSSNAGHFLSVLNVPCERGELIKAINAVIESFDDDRRDHQVFIQEYLCGGEMSGVILTRDLSSYAPYITINFDDETGKTDTITSGAGTYKTFVAFKRDLQIEDTRFRMLCECALELEDIFGNDALDIEFVIVAGIVHIMQVRPLAVKAFDNCDNNDHEHIHKTLKTIFDGISERAKPHPDLFGRRTFYGVMPDWNPAEMIGTKPRPLALSLYRELITDSIWAYQRDNYGYKRLRSFPLLVSLAGQPYIDLRVDFNSFLPKNISDELSHKLTDYYLDQLADDPSRHDKIEFDVVFSCYSLDLDHRLNKLPPSLFSSEDIAALRSALHEVTVDIAKREGVFWHDLKKIDLLENRRQELLCSEQSLISKIYWLIEDCKRYGTLPFAGIARAAFISMQFLRSFIELGIITPAEHAHFLRSLNTITKQFSRDLVLLRDGVLSKSGFIDKYGHLRPGTYDILSPSYRDSFEYYFDIEKIRDVEEEDLFTFSPNQMDRISRVLRSHSIPMAAAELIDFIREAIRGREYAKYCFTKNVSALLDVIKEYGQLSGFLADDLSYIEVSSLLRLYSRIGVDHKEKSNLGWEVEENKKKYRICHQTRLPDFICSPHDVFSFVVPSSSPNYITTNSISSKTAHISRIHDRRELCGRIVFTEGADPGFDWIFSHDIRGLVTMYGGINSHMAIRAAELDIPAVIGCGPVFYSEWQQADVLHIDCLNKKVIRIS